MSGIDAGDCRPQIRADECLPQIRTGDCLPRISCLRAQAEILGIAVIVVLLVLGLLFYLALGGTDSRRVAASKVREARDFGTSLEAAMLETTVKECGYSLSRALQNCAGNQRLGCSSETACDAARDMMKTILDAVLIEHGYAQEDYVARIRNGAQTFAPNQKSFEFGKCNDDVALVYAAPVSTIGLNQGTLEFSIAFCSS